MKLFNDLKPSAYGVSWWWWTQFGILTQNWRSIGDHLCINSYVPWFLFQENIYWRRKIWDCCEGNVQLLFQDLVFISYCSFLWVRLWKYIQQWRSAGCLRRSCPRMIYRQWEISTKMGWKKKDTLDTLPPRIIEVMVNMAVCNRSRWPFYMASLWSWTWRKK